MKSQRKGLAVFIPRNVWDKFDETRKKLNKKYPPEVAGVKIKELSENIIQEGVLNG